MKKKRNLKPVKLDPKFQKKLGILSIEPKIKRNPIIAQSGTYNGMKHETLGKDIEGWLEKPDIIVDSYTDMENIEDGSYEHIFIPYTLERMWPWETIPCLKECHRILKPGGHIALIIEPLESIGQALIEGDIHRTIHMPPDGTAALTPHNIMYGDPNKILKNTMYAKKQTFTNKWINSLLISGKFKPVQQTPLDASQMLIVGERQND
tara:strand:+ start:3450 stop:4070 length:621 start_codon:yes stop_codon:yes gene_type:complete